MSKFWSTLPKMEDSEKEGIISFEKPFDFESQGVYIQNDLLVNINMNQVLDTSIVYFILRNSLSPSGNSYLVNPKFLNSQVNTSIVQVSNNEILGFAMALNSRLCLNGQNLESALTTLLTVSTKHREINLAKYLISSIVDYGYHHQIYTGYHFIKLPRTTSSILCYTYFRPLNVKLALEFGYELPLNEYTVRPSSDYSIRKSEFSDLQFISKTNRHLNIDLKESEYNNLLIDGESLTIIRKNKIVGLCMYRPILLHIHKVNRLCPIVRIMYLEMLPKHTFHVVNRVIEYLSREDKYVVMSGVGLGELASETVRRNLGFVTSGDTHLDFYNLQVSKNFLAPEHINVLYC